MYAGQSNSHFIHLCWLVEFYSDLCCVSWDL